MRQFVCSVADPSRTFPEQMRVALAGADGDGKAPGLSFYFGRMQEGPPAGWRDDVPKLLYELTPATVRELRVDTDGVLHVDAMVDGYDGDFCAVKVALVPGVASNPPRDEWIRASSAVALAFLAFWQAESEAPGAGAVAAEGAAATAGDAPAVGDAAAAAAAPAAAPGAAQRDDASSDDDDASDDGDDEATNLPDGSVGASDAFTGALPGGLHGGAHASGGSVATGGAKSSSARMLKLKEVHEAALGLSRILSNVNVNKEARAGLSRRQFRRKLLHDQLSALAQSVSAPGAEDGAGQLAIGAGAAPPSGPSARHGAQQPATGFPPHYGGAFGKGPSAFAAGPSPSGFGFRAAPPAGFRPAPPSGGYHGFSAGGGGYDDGGYGGPRGGAFAPPQPGMERIRQVPVPQRVQQQQQFSQGGGYYAPAPGGYYGPGGHPMALVYVPDGAGGLVLAQAPGPQQQQPMQMQAGGDAGWAGGAGPSPAARR